MPKEYFASIDETLPSEAAIREINERLRRIGTAIGRLQGIDSNEVAFSAPMSLGGNRIRNVGTARKETDAVNVRFLRDRSIIAEPGEPLVASRILEAQGGVRVHEVAREPFDLVPLTQLEDHVAGAVSDAISSLPPPGGATDEDMVGTGTSFTTSTAYTTLHVWLNGLRLKEVVSSAGIGEFEYSGTTLTTGDTVVGGDWLTVTGYLTLVTEEDVPGTGTSFTLGSTYAQPHVILNGLRQKVVGGAPGVGEVAISGLSLTTGLAIVSGDWLHVEEST